MLASSVGARHASPLRIPPSCTPRRGDRLQPAEADFRLAKAGRSPLHHPVMCPHPQENPPSRKMREFGVRGRRARGDIFPPGPLRPAAGGGRVSGDFRDVSAEKNAVPGGGRWRGVWGFSGRFGGEKQPPAQGGHSRGGTIEGCLAKSRGLIGKAHERVPGAVRPPKGGRAPFIRG